ncbi:hypothetical protein JK163_11265 [Levilactobacillus brevis]|uniref:hypothetical protein n=1 Tax=Levilactobacillus brevis TaxID=1580 RepID=UPI001BA84383|nr:hypothetical protein [Levilactobacillus brevis]MBS1006847.1 hypothetical protein [Levilactobacillus brevis]
MKIIGQLYCTDGCVNSARDQTQYVVGFNEVGKNQVKKSCMAYIDDYFGEKNFEEERGISLKELLNSSELSISYERYVPCKKGSDDYDCWGNGRFMTGYSSGKGAKKVWVLLFKDDPYKEAQHG